jgi:hypothetical protein
VGRVREVVRRGCRRRERGWWFGCLLYDNYGEVLELKFISVKWMEMAYASEQYKKVLLLAWNCFSHDIL